jgi:hypothetical protein
MTDEKCIDYKVLVREPEGKMLLVTDRGRETENIEMYFVKMELELLELCI